MSKRQEFLDRIRDLQTDIKTRLDKGKFSKEAEKFCLEESLKNLSYAESYLSSYLQVDKYYGK